MKAAQNLLLAALVVVLALIAYDFHRFVRVWTVHSPAPAISDVSLTSATETREQRIERKRREIAASVEDFKETLEAATPAPRKAAATTDPRRH